MNPRRLTKLSAAEAGLLIEAALTLIGARAAIALLPFFRISLFFDRSITKVRREDSGRSAAAIGLAIDRLYRRLPWRPTCLVRSVAAMTMLRRRRLPGVLSIGARRPEDEAFKAHAWVVSAGHSVVGAGEANGFTVVTTCGQE